NFVAVLGHEITIGNVRNPSAFDHDRDLLSRLIPTAVNESSRVNNRGCVPICCDEPSREYRQDDDPTHGVRSDSVFENVRVTSSIVVVVVDRTKAVDDEGDDEGRGREKKTHKTIHGFLTGRRGAAGDS